MNNTQLPEKFVEKLPTFVPQEKMQRVLNGLSHTHSTTFRANTIKISSQEIKEDLKYLGFKIEQISWYKDAFMLTNKSKSELMNTSLFKEGKIYIQNLSSMIPALVLDPQPEEKILDMASSPGSKTTQLSALMENTGNIVANDKSPKRIFKLLYNLKQQGVVNVTTNAAPGEFMWRRYTDYFDRVLVDAPCTMEGRFNLEDPESLNDWSLRKVKELSNLQKWMLRSAISCTRPGGTIVYSTCAMSPEENEEVIDWAVKKMGNTINLDSISLSAFFSKGLTKWKNKVFSKELSKTLRIYPDNIFEGFFVAKLQKINNIVQ